MKNGRTTLRESLAVSPDGQTLTVTYTIYRGDRIPANGIAVFKKTKDFLPLPDFSTLPRSRATDHD
jgi:hypothetical protein